MNNNKSKVGDILNREIVEEAEFYDVVKEVVKTGTSDDANVTMTSILNKAGDYAGDAGDMRKFYADHGIAPELRSSDDCVCTIGWSEKEKVWYGWSHRAYYRYGIGDRRFEGTKLIDTLDEAKASACSYAEDVS